MSIGDGSGTNVCDDIEVIKETTAELGNNAEADIGLAKASDGISADGIKD